MWKPDIFTLKWRDGQQPKVCKLSTPKRGRRTCHTDKSSPHLISIYRLGQMQPYSLPRITIIPYTCLVGVRMIRHTLRRDSHQVVVDIKTKNVLNQKKSKPILQNNHAEIKREISCFLFKGYHGDRLSHLNTDTLSQIFS